MIFNMRPKKRRTPTTQLIVHHQHAGRIAFSAYPSAVAIVRQKSQNRLSSTSCRASDAVSHAGLLADVMNPGGVGSSTRAFL